VNLGTYDSNLIALALSKYTFQDMFSGYLNVLLFAVIYLNVLFTSLATDFVSFS